MKTLRPALGQTKRLGSRTGRLDATSKTQESLNLSGLMRLRALFQAAKKGPAGGMDLEEFVRSFRGVLAAREGERALRRLFLRIDADADGQIFWGELAAYLLDSEANTAATEAALFGDLYRGPGSAIPGSSHAAPMTALARLPPAGTSERYASAGQDGTLRVWNVQDLQHTRTLPLGPPGGSAWLTACLVLPHSQHLLVATLSCQLIILDAKSLGEAGCLRSTGHPVLCLTTWHRTGSLEYFATGDTSGALCFYTLKAPSVDPANPNPETMKWQAQRLWQGRFHSDWVSAVCYAQQVSCVVTASLDGDLCVVDVDRQSLVRRIKGGGSTHGILALDWSGAYKLVASGGLDHCVTLWHPFAAQAIAVLQGHGSSVVDVTVNDLENHVYSLSIDCVVKVWDIRNASCLQTLDHGKARAAGQPLALLCYDPRRRCLLTGSTRPQAWALVTTEAAAQLWRQGHAAPLAGVLFTPTFGEAISADLAGTVCVWAVDTGELRTRWDRAHGAAVVSCVALDGQGRRLLTGSDQGAIKIWNYSTGTCLRELLHHSHDEVSAITCLQSSCDKRLVVAARWDRRLSLFADAAGAARQLRPFRVIPEKNPMGAAPLERLVAADATLAFPQGPGGGFPAWKRRGHSADILAAAHLAGTSLMVTGGGDGLLIVTNIDSGVVVRAMAPRAHVLQPLDTRSVECLAALAPTLPQVVAAGYADGALRLWNARNGVCMLDMDAVEGVRDASVLALSVAPSGRALLTGSSQGRLAVWDLGDLVAGQQGGRAASLQKALPRLARWSAHAGPVAGVCWVAYPGSAAGGASPAPQGAEPAPAAPAMVLSAGLDGRVALWNATGSLVGCFGRHMWHLANTGTWVEPPEGVDRSHRSPRSPRPPAHFPMGGVTVGDREGEAAAAGGGDPQQPPTARGGQTTPRGPALWVPTWSDYWDNAEDESLVPPSLRPRLVAGVTAGA